MALAAGRCWASQRQSTSACCAPAAARSGPVAVSHSKPTKDSPVVSKLKSASDGCLTPVHTILYTAAALEALRVEWLATLALAASRDHILLVAGGFNGELGQPSSWVTSPSQVSGPVRQVCSLALGRAVAANYHMAFSYEKYTTCRLDSCKFLQYQPFKETS